MTTPLPNAILLPKLGVIAGGGELPQRIIDTCRAKSQDFFIIAIEGEAPPEAFADVPHAFFPIGSVGKIISTLKQQQVEELVLAGRIQRPSFSSLKIDKEGMKLLGKIMKQRFQGDNAVLSAVTAFLENAGFRLVGVEEIVDDLLAAEGAIGTFSPPDTIAKDDIKRGLDIAKTLGALDIGQAVVVQQGVVLCVEALEGTDALLQRASHLALPGVGGVLVKIKKPNQEKRVDLPTIGISTLENAHKAGLRGIAIEAGATLIINRNAVIQKANALGMFIIGVIS